MVCVAVLPNALGVPRAPFLPVVLPVMGQDLFPVLLVVFPCPEPPALELFWGEFFSFHGGQSLPGFVVEK